MTTTVLLDEKVREHRLRRQLHALDLQLEKSHSRNPEVPSYATYWILNPFLNTVEYGDRENGYGLTLDDVEAWLARP